MLKISQLGRALAYEGQYGNGREEVTERKPSVEGTRQAKIHAAQNPAQQTVKKIPQKKKNG